MLLMQAKMKKKDIIWFVVQIRVCFHDMDGFFPLFFCFVAKN